jgi:hypothetical protein
MLRVSQQYWLCDLAINTNTVSNLGSGVVQENMNKTLAKMIMSERILIKQLQ